MIRLCETGFCLSCVALKREGQKSIRCGGKVGQRDDPNTFPSPDFHLPRLQLPRIRNGVWCGSRWTLLGKRGPGQNWTRSPCCCRADSALTLLMRRNVPVFT